MGGKLLFGKKPHQDSMEETGESWGSYRSQDPRVPESRVALWHPSTDGALTRHLMDSPFSAPFPVLDFTFITFVF